MRLVQKSCLLLVLFFTVLSVSTFTVCEYLSNYFIDRLEVQSSLERLRMAEIFIERETQKMREKALDWSQWNESYDFVVSGNRKFVDDNLGHNSLGNMGVDYVAFCDGQGKIMASLHSEGFDFDFTSATRFIGKPENQDGVLYCGPVISHGKVFFLAMARIADSLNTKKADAYVVMVSNAAEVLASFHAPGESVSMKEWTPVCSESEMSDQYVSVCKELLIQDQRFQLVLVNERKLAERLFPIKIAAYGALAGFFLLSLLIFSWSLRRFCGRISSISSRLLEITSSRDRGNRLPEDVGDDEVSEIVQAANKLIKVRDEREDVLSSQCSYWDEIIRFLPSPMAVVSFDEGLFLLRSSNPAMDLVLGKNPSSWSALADETRDLLLSKHVLEKEIRIFGSVFRVVVFNLSDDSRVLVLSDLTELLSQQEELTRMAMYDNLTGLHNRTSFFVLLGSAIKNVSRGIDFAVVSLDLNGFKQANDRYGHPFGDQVLVEVAKRIKSSIRSSDVVARVGGDEFLVLATDINSTAFAEGLAIKIKQAIDSSPCNIDGTICSIGAAIGVYYSAQDVSEKMVLAAVDEALYRSKASGSVVLFDESMHSMMQRKNEITVLLAEIMGSGGLSVVFQPIMDLRSSQVVGAEVLVRWKHALLGQVSPAEFVPIAEESGAIKGIGLYVLNTVCRFLVKERRAKDLIDDFFISINLSYVQLLDTGHVDDMVNMIVNSRVNSSISFEIDERVVAGRSQEALRSLRKLKEIGCRILLHGYARHWSCLKVFGSDVIDGIKLAPIGEDKMLDGLVALAGSMEMSVIFEKISSSEEAQGALKRNCCLGQGNHISSPLSEDAFLTFLSQRTETAL